MLSILKTLFWSRYTTPTQHAKRFVRGASIIAAVIGFTLTSLCQTTPSSTLSQDVEAIAKAHHGDVALFEKNLKTGEAVSLEPDTPVQTASVIKLTILYEALEQIREGKARWDDKLTLNKAD